MKRSTSWRFATRIGPSWSSCFFAGLTMPKVAEVLGVSLATVERQWAYTKAWLLAELVHT